MIQFPSLCHNTLVIRFLSFLFLLFSLSSCSLWKEPDLLLVNIYGKWCKTCLITDPVFEQLQEDYWDDDHIDFVQFDESDPETLLESRELAQEYELMNLFEHERHTGEVLFVDAKTKEIKARFYGVEDIEKYKAEISNFKKHKKLTSYEAEFKSYDLSKPKVKDIQNAELLVVDIHHDLCGGCSVTAPIFEAVAKDFVNNTKVCFMTFDLTTNKTVDATKELAEQTGLTEIYDSHKHTGEVLFIDNKTKEILSTLVLERDKSKYYELIDQLS